MQLVQSNYSRQKHTSAPHIARTPTERITVDGDNLGTDIGGTAVTIRQRIVADHRADVHVQRRGEAESRQRRRREHQFAQFEIANLIIKISP